jgi:hypothetical protein
MITGTYAIMLIINFKFSICFANNQSDIIPNECRISQYAWPFCAPPSTQKHAFIGFQADLASAHIMNFSNHLQEQKGRKAECASSN